MEASEDFRRELDDDDKEGEESTKLLDLEEAIIVSLRAGSCATCAA